VGRGFEPHRGHYSKLKPSINLIYRGFFNVDHNSTTSIVEIQKIAFVHESFL